MAAEMGDRNSLLVRYLVFSCQGRTYSAAESRMEPLKGICNAPRRLPRQQSGFALPSAADCDTIRYVELGAPIVRPASHGALRVRDAESSQHAVPLMFTETVR
jgi:hypothetical protein